MATERQRAANQRNAKRSSGPRTRDGKSRSSRNATRHGLTTPPPSEDVVRWLKIILRDPEASVDSLAADEQGQAALALARSEAQLERTRDAERAAVAELFKYTKSHNEPDLMRLDPSDLDDPTVLRRLLMSSDVGISKSALRHLIAVSEKRLPKLRKWLANLERYARAAEREKAAAYSDWIARSE